MAIETVYKITQRNSWDVEPRLFSAYMDNDSRIEYFEGFFVRPTLEGSLLLAFAALPNALDFFRYSLNKWRNQVWEAEAEEPIHLERVASYDAYFIRFWKDFNQGGCGYGYTVSAPRGTVGCKAIKLVREITKEEIEEARRVAV